LRGRERGAARKRGHRSLIADGLDGRALARQTLPMASPRRLLKAHIFTTQINDATHRVTTLELFFDLVYVFAFTQITSWIAHEHSWRGTAQGLLVLAILWWTWVAWSWLGNVMRADRGAPLAAFITSAAAAFAIALTIRSVWEAEGGTLAPMTFAGFYLAIRVIHALVYLWGARGDSVLFKQILVTAAAWIPAAALLFVGALLAPEQRLWWWAGTLALDLGATWILAIKGPGWRVHSGGHFAERFGLIVILALGESVVAVGVAAESIALSPQLIGIAVLGVLTAVALWWPYFKDIGPTLEDAIIEAGPRRKVDIARAWYTYLHLPLVAGVILSAAGVEQAVSALEHHAHAGVAAVMLAAGAALFSATGALLMGLAQGEWRWLAASAAFFATGALWLPLLDAVPAIAVTAAALAIVGLATPRATREPTSV